MQSDEKPALEIEIAVQEIVTLRCCSVHKERAFLYLQEHGYKLVEFRANAENEYVVIGRRLRHERGENG